MKNGNKFEGTTTQSLLDMGKDIGEIKGMLINYDKRLSNLEKWRWLLTGGLMVLAATRFPQIAQIVGIQ